MLLAFGIARRWKNVYSNALTPGWVPTRMGGAGAPDDLEQAPLTQVWLATSEDARAKVSGKYWYHMHQVPAHPAAHDVDLQEMLFEACHELSGVKMPVR